MEKRTSLPTNATPSRVIGGRRDVRIAEVTHSAAAAAA